MTTTAPDRQPSAPGQALRRAALTHRCAAPGEDGTVEERVQLERLADELDAAPTTYSLPAEPPATVTKLWDRGGWHWRRDQVSARVHWRSAEWPDRTATWPELLALGPLSTIPPDGAQ